MDSSVKKATGAGLKAHQCWSALTVEIFFHPRLPGIPGFVDSVDTLHKTKEKAGKEGVGRFPHRERTAGPLKFSPAFLTFVQVLRILGVCGRAPYAVVLVSESGI